MSQLVEPVCHNYWAHLPQLEKPLHSEEDSVTPKKKKNSTDFPEELAHLYPRQKEGVLRWSPVMTEGKRGVGDRGVGVSPLRAILSGK